ncbi:MAG: AraC family transcriptional regulator [Solirubrobacteraceae bacterium]|nr:AraC family transcriptional regulator [Solirubrobacteraceae bacterium]
MHVDSSTDADSPAPSSVPPTPSVDRLGGLLERFGVTATLIEAEPLRFPRLYGDGGVAPGVGHLHVVSRGTLQVEHADGHPEPARLVIEEPTLLLYPAPIRHRFIPVDRPEVTCAALEFGHGGLHPLVRALPAVTAVPIASVDGLAPSLALLTAETEHVRCGHRLLASRLLDVILVQLLRWLFDHPDAAGVHTGLVAAMTHPGLAAALVAIHDRPGDPWPLERLAAEAAMSRSAFAAAFRERLGETPAAYVADYRIAVAQQRLLAGDAIVSLAYDLGYADPSGLSRAFARRTGQSPTAWLAASSKAAG